MLDVLVSLCTPPHIDFIHSTCSPIILKFLDKLDALERNIRYKEKNHITFINESKV